MSTVRLQTGITMHYEEAGDPKGKPVIFIHGYPDSWISFRLVTQSISPEFRSFMIDLRGFGDSDRPKTGYSQKELAEDVIAFLDKVKIERAVLVGHSMGSFIAQSAALLHPSRVEKLILVGSAATAHGNSAIIEVLNVVTVQGENIDREFVSAFQEGTGLHDVPRDFLDSIIEDNLKVPPFVWRDALSGLEKEDHSTELHKIFQPTYIVWGNKDVLFSWEDQEELLDLLPNATLTVYEGYGHSPNWDNPDVLSRDIEKFLYA